MTLIGVNISYLKVFSCCVSVAWRGFPLPVNLYPHRHWSGKHCQEQKVDTFLLAPLSKLVQQSRKKIEEEDRNVTVQHVQLLRHLELPQTNNWLETTQRSTISLPPFTVNCTLHVISIQYCPSALFIIHILRSATASLRGSKSMLALPLLTMPAQINCLFFCLHVSSPNNISMPIF